MSKQRFQVLGARIAYYRKLKGMTQLDLALAAEISEDYVSLIENGKAPGLTIATGIRIADALGVELGDLVQEQL